MCAIVWMAIPEAQRSNAGHRSLRTHQLIHSYSYVLVLRVVNTRAQHKAVLVVEAVYNSGTVGSVRFRHLLRHYHVFPPNGLSRLLDVLWFDSTLLFLLFIL